MNTIQIINHLLPRLFWASVFIVKAARGNNTVHNTLSADAALEMYIKHEKDKTFDE